jgi:hypothetical protein
MRDMSAGIFISFFLYVHSAAVLDNAAMPRKRSRRRRSWRDIKKGMGVGT